MTYPTNSKRLGHVFEEAFRDALAKWWTVAHDARLDHDEKIGAGELSSHITSSVRGIRAGEYRQLLMARPISLPTPNVSPAAARPSRS